MAEGRYHGSGTTSLSITQIRKSWIQYTWVRKVLIPTLVEGSVIRNKIPIEKASSLKRTIEPAKCYATTEVSGLQRIKP